MLRTVLKWLLAVLFIAAGINHFLQPAVYAALIPPMLPAPRLLVYLSGLIEAGLGALLLWPRTERLAAWGLIATLVAVFPANLYHALSGGLEHPDLPPLFANATLAWIRLPLQGVFIAWAWWFARNPSDPSASRDRER